VHSLLASDTALARQLGEAETGCRGLMLCYDGLVAFDSGDQRLELPARDLTRLGASGAVAATAIHASLVPETRKLPAQ